MRKYVTPAIKVINLETGLLAASNKIGIASTGADNREEVLGRDVLLDWDEDEDNF